MEYLPTCHSCGGKLPAPYLGAASVKCGRCGFEYHPLPKEGMERTQVLSRRGCDVCGGLATKRITYLRENCRSNPASSAYGRDDCSWCSDAEAYSCDEHQREVERDAPEGMRWASTFDGLKLPHMLLEWRTVEEAVNP